MEPLWFEKKGCYNSCSTPAFAQGEWRPRSYPMRFSDLLQKLRKVQESCYALDASIPWDTPLHKVCGQLSTGPLEPNKALWTWFCVARTLQHHLCQGQALAKVWWEQHCYKLLHKGERDQIISPSLSISCHRGVLGEGGGHRTSLLGWRHLPWQHCDSAGSQSQAVPGSRMGWAMAGRWRQQSKREAQTTWEVWVPWARKQSLPWAFILLGTVCHWQYLVISGAPAAAHLSPGGTAWPAQGRTNLVHWNLHVLFCPFLMLMAAEATHQHKPASHQLFPLCSSPSTQWAQAVRFFFLSPHQISLSLWNIQMIWFCSLLPHIKSSPCLWKQWISPRHRRLIYTLQGLK